MRQMGKVYLVGAGPGDPELITLRGLKCLRQADVVIYDRLVSEALLDEAPPEAERIFVGKAPGLQTLSQDAINRLLVERARAGQIVVRLKGGDPFVFGRGGEEIAACVAAGIPWEVVPGVSSAIGVPTSAGIPVTHRGISSSFAVITGSRANGQDDLDWAVLAHIDTLIVLMGARRISHIADRLIEHGRPPDTPVAVIERGTYPDARVITGALRDIGVRAAAADIRPPAIIVIGEVVRWSELLHGTWEEPALEAMNVL